MRIGHLRPAPYFPPGGSALAQANDRAFGRVPRHFARQSWSMVAGSSLRSALISSENQAVVRIINKKPSLPGAQATSLAF
jgi:hypothetical protein